MELEWAEADPNHFLRIQGFVVEVDGVDYSVTMAGRDGLYVREWDDDTGAPRDGTDERLIPWEDVKRLFIY